MKEKNSIQYDMILKLVQIKKICDDTAKNIDIDSIISNNLADMQDIIEELSDNLLELEQALTAK